MIKLTNTLRFLMLELGRNCKKKSGIRDINVSTKAAGSTYVFNKLNGWAVKEIYV